MKSMLLLAIMISSPAAGQGDLDLIEVKANKEDSFSGFWEENKGTQIFSGKKNTVTDLKEIPKLQTNNYRQATSQTPGLLISEIPNESLAAMTYRGLGDPHESYNILLLQDGVPVAADMFAYPAHYYAPALPMMDSVQFVRGGAGLLYGPQPGGVLNYSSRPLKKNQKGHGQVSLTAGQYNLKTTNNAYYGSKGDQAYGVEYHRRQGDGPQRVNSDFRADYVQIRDHIFKGKNKYILSFNGYNSDHGEAGGFAKNGGNEFGGDLGKATKEHDRLKVSRAAILGGVEHRIDDSSQIDVKIWATAYNRYSKRQRGGGFGTFPSGGNANTNDIVTQKYYGHNGEIRYLKNYSAFGNDHTFTAGVLTYHLLSPIHQERGSAAGANHGATQKRSDRATHANSYFMENRFAFNKFMITPGFRFENIRQTIDERVVTSGNNRQSDRTDNVPLFGLGMAYHVTEESQVYANVSEAYRPLTWSDAIPNEANQTVAGDIRASKILSKELGHRGQTKFLNWDVSAFYLRYENKIALVNNVVKNSGAGRHQGVDIATEFKLSNIFQDLKKTGNFNFYSNVEFLDARFTRGGLNNNAPQYAPKTIARSGLIYSKEDLLKIALMGVFVSEHFGSDDNSSERGIPSYTVFDLTAEYTFQKNWMVSGGVNNLLDKNYYSRVRSDGIIWALDRNFYAGVTYKF